MTEPNEPVSAEVEVADPTAEPGLYLVAVGASAGGLEALDRLFESASPRDDVAYVVIQHLSPDYESHMVELLTKRTDLKVQQADQGREIRGGTVYLLPPGKTMTISAGKLELLEARRGGLNLPIDIFFESMAADYGGNGIAVVLSGTGSDGSRGLRHVKEAGGLVMAQDDSAKFDGMPRSAIATQLVDFVAPPEQIPHLIERHLDHPSLIVSPAAAEVHEGNEMTRLFASMQAAVGVDFSGYKKNTIARRIQRRMSLLGLDDFGQYLILLQEQPNEARALYRELLIGVTGFFRDPEAFEQLRLTVIEPLVKRGDTIRIWVAGCATGEEAYSIAILFAEAARKLDLAPKVKIFATDLDQNSLVTASRGTYSKAALQEVSNTRLERFFRLVGGEYEVKSEIRGMVVFARHDLTRDPPFSRIDFVSCRNLLIYFKPELQNRVLTSFHFSLRPGGFLFLGSSESVSSDFNAVDATKRIYTLTEKRARSSRDPVLGRAPITPRGLEPERQPDSALQAMADQLFPTSIVVDPDGHLLHAFGAIDRFLKLPKGAGLRFTLREMLDPDLRLAVPTAIQRALSSAEDVRFNVDTPDRRIVLTARGFFDKEKHTALVLVTFDEMAVESPVEETESFSPDKSAASRIESLEQELMFTKESLQATLEEAETANEELQATNEELTAANEELQSTNEELQSVNEELLTVNSQYQEKIRELQSLNDDMDNLLRTTEIGTIFVDRDLLLRKFTPAVGEAVSLVDSDVGRPLGHFVQQIEGANLVELARDTMATLERSEAEAVTSSGKTYLIRSVPYRTRDDHVSGAVLTLIDITERRRMEHELEASQRDLQLIYDNVQVAIFTLDVEPEGVLRYSGLNQAYEKMTGFSSERFVGRSLVELEFMPLADRNAMNTRYLTCVNKRHVVRFEETVHFGERETNWVTILLPLFNESDQVYRVIGSALEISDQKAAQAAIAANEAKTRFLASMSHELRTPLNAIIGFSELLAGNQDLPRRARHQVSTVRNSGRHLLALIDDILAISRIEAGREKLQLSPSALGELIDDVVEMLQVNAEKKGLQLTVERETDIPGTARIDAKKLRQVILNLLNNAVKYTDSGSISLGVGWADDRLSLQIVDTGPGIPKRAQARIFESFEQLDVGSGERGVGLGLAICKRFIELMGGEIGCDSEVGRGSRFWFVIPCQEQLDGEVAEETQDQRAADKVILVVDDEPSNLELLRSMTEMLGADVAEATSGEEALEVFARIQPDLVFMDLKMAGMGGINAIGEIRKSDGGDKTKIVAVTAHVYDEDRRIALDAGPDDFIAKPFTALQIYHAVVRNLQIDARRPDRAPVQAGTPDLAGLPTDWLHSLAQAARLGSVKDLEQLILDLRASEPELADWLDSMTADMAFDQVVNLATTALEADR